MRVAYAVALGVLGTAFLACANDTAATIAAGGLIPIKSSAIVMESEDLQISISAITVNYRFRNTSARDLEIDVAFPLPEIDGGLVANSPVNIPYSDPLNFVDFQVSVDGKRIAPQTEIRSFFDGHEITRDLRALGLPLSPLDGRVTAAVEKLAAEDRSKLQKDQWMDCQLSRDGRCWPLWQSRVQFYWRQRFPAGVSVGIRHTYSPIVGGGYIVRSDDGKLNAESFCGGLQALNDIRRLKQLHPERGDLPRETNDSVLIERKVEYILTTANNWAGPIGHFRLLVVADSSDDIVLTCMPGLERVAPTRYELVRSNFSPDRELQLLVLQAHPQR